jgi:hypothetical protein
MTKHRQPIQHHQNLKRKRRKKGKRREKNHLMTTNLTGRRMMMMRKTKTLIPASWKTYSACQLSNIKEMYPVYESVKSNSIFFLRTKYCEIIINQGALFVGTNFRGFYKMHWSMGSWIHDFTYYRQQSMWKLYFVGF